MAFDETGPKNRVNTASPSNRLLTCTPRVPLLLEQIVFPRKDETKVKKDPKKADAASPEDKPLSFEDTIDGLCSKIASLAIPKPKEDKNVVNDNTSISARINGDQSLLEIIYTHFKQNETFNKEFEIKYKMINHEESEIHLKSASKNITEVRDVIDKAFIEAFCYIEKENKINLALKDKSEKGTNEFRFEIVREV